MWCKLPFIALLMAAVAASVVACPLWAGPLVPVQAPCSRHDTESNECPAVVCQASSPYLVETPGAETSGLELADVLPGTPEFTGAIETEFVLVRAPNLPAGDLPILAHSLRI